MKTNYALSALWLLSMPLVTPVNQLPFRPDFIHHGARATRPADSIRPAQPVGPTAPAASLTHAERTYAVDLLQKTKADLLRSVQGLSDAQLRYKPDSTRWSVAQCVEHITLAEIGIFQMEQGAMNVPADPAKRAEIRVTDEQVVRILTNRTGKATSPEMIRPTGRFPSVQAALQAFGQQRDRTIDYVKTTPDELRTHYWKHMATGTIDAYQTILLLAAHGERHRLQIEELKAGAGFPQ